MSTVASSVAGYSKIKLEYSSSLTKNNIVWSMHIIAGL